MGGTSITIADRPLLLPRDKFLNPTDLHAKLKIAAGNLKDRRFQWLRDQGWRSLVLVLRDTDGELPCVLGPEILDIAQGAGISVDVSCVLAHYEYETWFVASADSLSGFLDLPGEPTPMDPEGQRLKKKWIEDRFKGPGWRDREASTRKISIRYQPPIDQPPMTEVMNLEVCRERSPSFAKLCRDLERFRNQENQV